MNSLQHTFGNIDIYLFDQLLKGCFDQCQAILDIGCGGGRNIFYFLRQGCNVFGIDQSAEAVAAVQQLAAALAPALPRDHFQQAEADQLPHDDASFDLVISSAVLHFAQDEAHFDRMVREAWRVLQPGGFFFARLASDIGIESLVHSLGNRRYLLPDGSQRFLVNEAMLLNYSRELGGTLFEPVKTTNVQNLRCMTTWCLQKKK